MDAGGFDGGNDTLTLGHSSGSDTVAGWHPEADFIHFGDLTQAETVVTQLGQKQREISNPRGVLCPCHLAETRRDRG